MEMNVPFNRELIAPCGMNCGICLANLRDKNQCLGCRNITGYKAKSCQNCIIANCDKLARTESNFCFDCNDYPCKRLKQLDKRYRTKYNMSMLENLETIQKFGLEEFLLMEQLKWTCTKCGGTICVHRGYCLKCNMN